jgi:hypothetical protein
MGLDRVIAKLGVVIVALVAATVVYGVVGVVWGTLPGVERVPDQSIGWPLILPAWPVVALFAAALVVTVLQAPLIVVSRSRRRKLAQRLGAEADEWLRGGSARAVAGSGLALTKVTGLRAHARGPRDVELSWNPPLDEVDEVVVLRSTTAFATSPDAQDGQVVAYSGDEAAYADTGLEDDCVYHYTAFARSRNGRWSAPAWAWVTTPASPLHVKMLGTLRMSDTWLNPWQK